MIILIQVTVRDPIFEKKNKNKDKLKKRNKKKCLQTKNLIYNLSQVSSIFGLSFKI